MQVDEDGPVLGAARSWDITPNRYLIPISGSNAERVDSYGTVGNILWYLSWRNLCLDLAKDTTALHYADLIQIAKLGVGRHKLRCIALEAGTTEQQSRISHTLVHCGLTCE